MSTISEEPKDAAKSASSETDGSLAAGPAGVAGNGIRGTIQGFFESPEGESPEGENPLPWSREWGLGQIVLGIVFVSLVPVVAFSLGSALGGPDVLDAVESGTAGLVTVLSLLSFQAASAAWPFLVTKFWRGRGVVKDWGLRFEASDLWTGLLVAMIALVCVPLMATLMGALVGLEDQSEASNTDFLVDAKGSPWLYAIVFGSVIGAPVAEEIFFRGFIQRTLERFGGRVVGILGSTVLFALPHFTGAALKPTVVLLTSISVVGLLFGIVAAATRRIGPTIIGHILFNGTVVAFTIFSAS